MFLIGYDIGSSSIKVALIEAQSGKVVHVTRTPKEEMEIAAPQDNWAEQSPDAWWEYLCEGTKDILATTQVTPSAIKAIGISYQMHGLVMVDKTHEPIRPAIIWCDSRAVQIGQKAFEEEGVGCLNHLLNSPGNFTASKLKWVKDYEPENYAKIHKIMLPGDFIAMKMTDEITTTISGLSEGVFWDFQKNEIAPCILNRFGFSKKIFPTIKNTFSVQGKVTTKAAEQLGLIAGIPVTYRAGDQPNNALSLNVLNAGEIAATGGTSGVVYGVVDKPVFDIKSRVNSFAHVNYTVENQKVGVLLCINGAGIQNSWMKQIAGRNLTYSEMNELAQSVPIGSDKLLVLPFGNGAERVLENQNINAHISNLKFNIHTKAHLFRATLEGIAFSFVYGIEILKEIGLDVNVMRVGNDNLFQSKIFSETIATLANCKIEVAATTGAVGAAKASGVAIGIHKTVRDAVQELDIEAVFEPQSDNQPYVEAYKNWKRLLDRTVDDIAV